MLALARAHPLLRSDPAEVSRVRGQTAFAFPAPSVAIARNGSFAPTRSARTPAVVDLVADTGWRGRSRRAHTCLRVPRRAHRADLLARKRVSEAHQTPEVNGRPAGPDWSSRGSFWYPRRAREPARKGGRFRDQPPTPGPLPAPLREERRVLLHPRCLPSMCVPIRERAFTLP